MGRCYDGLHGRVITSLKNGIFVVENLGFYKIYQTFITNSEIVMKKLFKLNKSVRFIEVLKNGNIVCDGELYD